MLAARLKLIAESNTFNNFITGVILLACLLVGLHTYPEFSQKHYAWLHILDDLVLYIFIAEVIIKMGAEGRKPWRYFYDGWNVFDFLIVVACLMPATGSFAAVFRLARVFRVLRLITAIPKLQVLVGALINSVPSITYISVLLFIHFYMFAVVGTMFFGANDPVHFGSLHLALLSLFRVVTLEDWTDIMYIQMYGSDVYYPDQFFQATSVPEAFPVFAPLFFIAFILLGTMIILNLFIGVIMNGMSEMERKQEAEALKKQRANTEIICLTEEIAHLHEQLDQFKEHLDMISQVFGKDNLNPDNSIPKPKFVPRSKQSI